MLLSCRGNAVSSFFSAKKQTERVDEEVQRRLAGRELPFREVVPGRRSTYTLWPVGRNRCGLGLAKVVVFI